MMIKTNAVRRFDGSTIIIEAKWLFHHGLKKKMSENKKKLLFSLIYIQTMMKESLCLDNDGRTIETSDSISFNFPNEVF